MTRSDRRWIQISDLVTHHDRLHAHRRTTAARAVGPRMGRARGCAATSGKTIASTASIASACSAAWRSSACSACRCRPSTAAPGWTTSRLGLASEELEYVDTSLRVIMSVHAGLNCLTLLTWGTEDQKQRYLVPQAQGAQDRRLRPHRAVGGQRRARHPDDGGQEGQPLCRSRARRAGSRSPNVADNSSCSRGPTRRRRSSAIPPASAPSLSSARSRDLRAAR